jgi:hypothetical protein
MSRRVVVVEHDLDTLGVSCARNVAGRASYFFTLRIAQELGTDVSTREVGTC